MNVMGFTVDGLIKRIECHLVASMWPQRTVYLQTFDDIVPIAVTTYSVAVLIVWGVKLCRIVVIVHVGINALPFINGQMAHRIQFISLIDWCVCALLRVSLSKHAHNYHMSILVEQRRVNKKIGSLRCKHVEQRAHTQRMLHRRIHNCLRSQCEQSSALSIQQTQNIYAHWFWP